MNTKKAAKNSLIFLVTEFFLKTAGFLLMPLYTRKISPTEFGEIYLLTTFSSFFITLVTFRIDSAIMRYYYSCKNNAEIKSLYSNIVNFASLLYLIVSAIVILFKEYIQLFLKIEFFPCVFIILIYSYFNIIYSISYTLLIVEERAKFISVVSIIGSFAGIFSTIIFVFSIEDKVLAYILGLLVVGIIQFGVSLLLGKKYYILKIDSNIKKYVKYSLKRIPFELGAWVVTFSDRIVLTRYHGMNANGIYSIGYKFGQIIEVFTGATAKAYVPVCFKSFSEEENNNDKFIVQYTTYLFSLYIVVATGLLCFSNEMIFLLGEGYKESRSVFVIITITYLVGGLVYLFQPILDYKEELVKKKQIIWIFVAIINLALNFLLIPKFSFNGAAIATLIAYLFMLVAIILMASKYGNQKYEISKMVKTLLISVLYALTIFFELSWINVISKCIISILYILLVLKIIGISVNDILKVIRRK